MKVVINCCYGGFGLSPAGEEYFQALGGDDIYETSRADSALIRTVEELGEESWGRNSQLKIVEVPDGVDWEIEEYDGIERVVEAHRIWL